MSCKKHEPVMLKPYQNMNTKQLYGSEIYFIRKHKQPWSENIKYHFVCVSHVFFFQDFITVLDFIS